MSEISNDASLEAINVKPNPNIVRKVIIINGGPAVGKDTVCKMVGNIMRSKYLETDGEDHIRVDNHSSVGKVKDAYKILGWNGIKSPEHRKNLSDLKDLSTRMFDGPFKEMSRVIGTHHRHTDVTNEGFILFLHIREPKEIDKLCKSFDIITLLISRETEESITNHADLKVENFKYDYHIDNNGSLEDLKFKVIKFIKEL